MNSTELEITSCTIKTWGEPAKYLRRYIEVEKYILKDKPTIVEPDASCDMTIRKMVSSTTLDYCSETNR